jgi:hypothetical protein
VRSGWYTNPTSLCGSGTGSGRSINASINENAAVHAPMASESESTAAEVTARSFARMRTPNRAS